MKTLFKYILTICFILLFCNMAFFIIMSLFIESFKVIIDLYVFSLTESRCLNNEVIAKISGELFRKSISKLVDSGL